MNTALLPKKQGLYDPRFEHDACGVGFVCDVKGRSSHKIITDALTVLRRLSHRGATGADPKTGDGAGVLLQIPHEFFADACLECKIKLPPKGRYGTGLIFLPTDKHDREFCKRTLKKAARHEGCDLLGWRKVPLDGSVIGKTAKESMPVIEQVFIIGRRDTEEEIGFESRLYLIRKGAEATVRNSPSGQKSFFYITNISCRTFLYKGLLMPSQVGDFFLDLKNPMVKSALCLIHSRYSTNTFPTWDLSQPFRLLAHNGEINTLRGNINWMKAREGLISSRLFGKDIKRIFPVITPGGSDSAALDNVFELLVLAGRSMPHAMKMLIPSAWEEDVSMDNKLRGFYRYHASIMEPWDGPAAIAFTDGISIGACLDRNGLRPARYLITKNGLVVMASEVGVLDIAPEEIAASGRLEPGKIFFIDTKAGRIIDDQEIRKEIASRKPYAEWARNRIVSLGDIPSSGKAKDDLSSLPVLLKAFGYTREDLKFIIKPMAERGLEPIGSMGDDTPHAILSNRPRHIYSYFKQLFAQVTNPPIDPIREELVMSLDSYLGPEKNILGETPEHCHKLLVNNPILTDEELGKIRDIKVNGFATRRIPILFDVADKKDFERSLKRICADAVSAIKKGYTFILLSDRGIDRKNAAIPALIAVGALHHHLVKKALRKKVAIIIESGEPREVHHFALLFGYGADCINPYLAYQAVRYLYTEGELSLGVEIAQKEYVKASHKGILKILSKMGISTLQSYRGAQIFEALGLGDDIIENCFTGTVSRIGGAGFDVIRKECIMRHEEAYGSLTKETVILNTGGVYQWKKDGEYHLWNPDSISALQDAARLNDYKIYKTFAGLINDQSTDPCTLRSLLKFKKVKPVPMREVEPAEELVKRFATGAMSFGSISRDAHETLALAMNKIGAKSNTGEGGEDPARFHALPNGNSVRSSIKQIASGRFGVTTNYLVNADEIQIKIAQGAKPGEGGQLPGHKVNAIIARTRYTTQGVTLISPPPHHDIYSIEDLAQLIFDLKNVNPRARISVKLVSEIGVGTVAAGVAKGRADMILISGGDGGTGASPLSSIKNAGLPWELGISETHQTLVLNGLRDRVRLQTDGQMRTGRDVAIAAMLGAEEFGFATSALIVCGCVMLRHCHLNNCSVGVATQDEVLSKRFRGKEDHLINYFRFVAEELREIMASMGIRRLEDMVGRTDLLKVDRDKLPWKARDIDFSKILYKPASRKQSKCSSAKAQDHGIDNVLDIRLIDAAQPALKSSRAVTIDSKIENTDRAAGAMLSGEVCRLYGEEGLPEETLHYRFDGIAGQSFGAFLAKGITFELRGMANDYVGKGISGGTIIIYPDEKASLAAEDNIIIGNTAFYGAIGGQAYIKGMAGERFCVRNSGLLAVVEGMGDHGCEYMTGGRVVVLGKTGRNFAAGMSGGIAYVYDPDKRLGDRCNPEMVEMEKLNTEDEATLRNLIYNHYKYTGSPKAKYILDDFGANVKKFVKVMPIEYKRVLGMVPAGEVAAEFTEVSDG